MTTISADLFAAIKTAWDAAGTLSGIAGPYRDKIGSVLPAPPYCVFKTVSNNRILRTTSSEYWDHRFRFLVYHPLETTIESNLVLIAAVFDPLAYSLGAGKGSIVQQGRESESYMTVDKAMAMGYVEYRVTRQKPV